MSLNMPSLSELRDTQAEINRFQGRVVVIQWVVLLCFVLLASRLVYLQVVRHEDLMEQAENNRTAILPTVPTRGNILDRNGLVLANNYSAYTLEITPSKVSDLEATIDELAKLVEIHSKDRRRFKRLRDESRSFDSLPILMVSWQVMLLATSGASTNATKTVWKKTKTRPITGAQNTLEN